ncbi:taste receptor type 2 member 8-like [Engystomops pustulosus]|uniref:taste receptor type 2 member 8-like n=1 Tax=Engystomops pustulosus TaxID=76066 RepID=UPI003AFA7731
METINDPKVLASVVVLAMELTVGLFLNVFIVSIIFYDFYTQKQIIDSNKILCGLCISNVMYNLLISAGLLDEFVGLRSSSTVDLSPMYNILLLYSICSCAWFTAGLGAFYFIKISPSRFLSWIKLHLSSIVSWMILVLEVVSFINSSLSSLLISAEKWRNITDTPPTLMGLLADKRLGIIEAGLVITFLPVTIVLSSTMCTIWTLKTHGHKMERRMETVDTKHQMSYMRVVSRMTQSLFYYGLLYTLMVIFYFSITTKLETGFWTIIVQKCFKFPALLASYTTLQSFVLQSNIQDHWGGR